MQAVNCALLAACWNDDAVAALQLLKQGAEPNVFAVLPRKLAKTDGRPWPSNHPTFPLEIVAFRNNEHVAKVLLQQRNLNVRQQDRFGETALMMACQRNHFAIVALLLKRDPKLAMQKTHNHITPLLMCIHYKCHESMQELLKLPNIKVQDPPLIHETRVNHFLSPIMRAMNNRNHTAAQMLLEHPQFKFDSATVMAACDLGMASVACHMMVSAGRLLSRARRWCIHVALTDNIDVSNVLHVFTPPCLARRLFPSKSRAMMVLTNTLFTKQHMTRVLRANILHLDRLLVSDVPKLKAALKAKEVGNDKVPYATAMLYGWHVHRHRLYHEPAFRQIICVIMLFYTFQFERCRALDALDGRCIPVEMWLLIAAYIQPSWYAERPLWH